MERNEAIEIVKRNYPHVSGSGTQFESALRTLIPELKESEDEQNRKWILEYLYDGLRKSDEQFKDQFKCAIAWLKKQGERNTDNSIWYKVEPEEYVLEKTLICKKNGEIDLVEHTLLSETDAEYALPISSLGIPKSLEKQGEQNLANSAKTCKVEPKFKVGDWVTIKE